MAKWIGYAVSVNCGEPLGCYQGTILAADGNTITLTKAFRNGFPYPKSQVTLNAADIRELNIIETRAEPAAPAQSTVAVAKGRKTARATVCENLQASHSTTDAGGSSTPASAAKPGGGKPRPADPPRSKPIDIQPPRSNKNNNHAGSYGAASSTPKARGGGAGAASGGHERARRRNEACFGDAAAALDTEFDFEGNLALFDKRALWEQMSAKPVPDLVRHAEKLRHDENVLGPPPPTAGISLPPWFRVYPDYVTDEGVVVPAASAALRAQLWAGLGPLRGAAGTLLGRAVADVALRLAGGGRRLEPRNAHQAPSAVILASQHVPGLAALVAGRLLAGLGARVAVHTVGVTNASGGELATELAGLRGAGVCARALERLPAADVVVAALHDPEDERGFAEEDRAAVCAAAGWARAARGALLVVEPGAPDALNDVGTGRASVCALLPGGGARRGLLLADVGAPAAAWAATGVAYRSPFGARSLVALHPTGGDD